jgi:hypothetical protein
VLHLLHCYWHAQQVAERVAEDIRRLGFNLLDDLGLCCWVIREVYCHS